MTTILRAAASILSIFAMSSVSYGAIIYFDSFAGANNDALAGRLPEVNNGVSGASYARHNITWAADIQGNKLRLGADNGASLDIASSGAYTQPPIMQISVTMNLGTILGSTTPANTGTQRGIGLGFYEGTGANAASTNWRGLFLGTDGRLILGQAGVGGAGANQIGFLAEIATGINTGIDHTLSYWIDTTTGDVSNILLDGVLQSDVTTTLFSSGVNRAGMTSSSTTGNTYSYFDNFSLNSVPEPSSALLVAVGTCVFAIRRR